MPCNEMEWLIHKPLSLSLLSVHLLPLLLLELSLSIYLMLPLFVPRDYVFKKYRSVFLIDDISMTKIA